MLHPFPLSLATLDAIRAERDKLDPYGRASVAGVNMPGAVVGYDDLLEHYRLLVEERDGRAGDQALLRNILQNIKGDASRLSHGQLVHRIEMVRNLLRALLLDQPEEAADAPPDPRPGFPGFRAPSRLDALPAHELVSRALASLGLGTGKAARLLRTDVRTLQRVRAGGRDVLPDQWRTLAAALDARALYERHARELAGACRRRADPVDEFLEE